MEWQGRRRHGHENEGNTGEPARLGRRSACRSSGRPAGRQGIVPAARVAKAADEDREEWAAYRLLNQDLRLHGQGRVGQTDPSTRPSWAAVNYRSGKNGTQVG